MEFTAKSGNPEKQRTACIVVGVFEPRRLSPAAERLDQVSDGFISNLIRRGDLEGKIGQTLLLHNVPNTLCDRILLIGCGRERELHDAQYRKIIATAATTLNDIGAMEAVCYLTELHVKGRDNHWNVRQAVETVENSLYSFDQLKSKKDTTRRPLRKIVMSVASRRELQDSEDAVTEGYAIAQGVKLAKDLGNLPGNICTPSYLAEQALALAHQYDSIDTEILEQKDMEQLGMGALLSVAKGSRQPPKLICMRHTGNGKDKPIVLVGKGLTFDAGGISLKPAAAMDEMKYDMCGGASVFGVMRAVAELKLPLNIIGVVPASENLPDGAANKPGDVVTSMSGQTIEILNTDAEGRLILCDALSYAEKYEPEAVIDIATLTGACVIALGKHASGLLSNHSPLAHDLLNAGKSSGDRAWELPLWEEYNEQLKSPFADLANIGGREGGAITAAAFLSNFTKKYDWAHLDIAGSAWLGGDKKGATGRPVPLLTQYLLDRCKEK
ncbi:aminopeptidase [Candidatus Tenderia electrophaga]|jgi:leucyl aminopeptidase|uniref:Probable cytosol aminopeptidase n=1 Tax=Candidatus Tenderia electrophaga TaxID=1748243 RepID=A0A0S2TBB2_9GAMM|nr:aminopeptidase [Candidatus Tenderia electrophaga]